MSQATPHQHSPAVEDYIKHIYKLSTQGEKATTKAIAEKMGLGDGTVSAMLRQLDSRGLLLLEPYRGVELTEEGRRLALRMIRRHRLIELFLVKVLNLEWDEVDSEAERLEHAFTDTLIERLDAFLGYPDVDPHGAPIPDDKGKVARQNFIPLQQAQPGRQVTIRRVSDDDPDFLKYLKDMGLHLNSTLTVQAIGPFGAMQLKLGDKDIHLAREATQRIFIS